MEKRTALGIYIFAGGFAIGIKNAGFRIVAHFEGSNYGVPTFKANFRDVPVFYPKVAWPIKRFIDVDIIYANPPCAAWSMSGKTLRAGKTSWLSDPRVKCVDDVFEVFSVIKPKILVWESVTQVWTRARALIQKLTIQAKKLGYKTYYLFTSAFLHGVPQPRKRFMMFCSRIELDLRLPDLRKIRNIKDALELECKDGQWIQGCPVWGHPESQDRYTRLIRMTPPGESAEDTWEEVFSGEDDGWGNDIRPAFMVKRVDMYGPGTTFTSQIKDYHPIFNRLLTDSEVGRLSGWPDDYIWIGQGVEGPIRAQMAQAVLPPVAEYTGNVLLEALNEDLPVKDLEPELVSHIKEAGL